MIVDTRETTHRTEAEIQLELEQTKRARIQEEKELAESQKSVAALLEERRNTAFNENLKKEILATGLKAFCSDEEVKLVMQKRGVTFNVDNSGTFSLTDGNGRRVEFDVALESLAREKPWLFDARTTKRLDREESQRQYTRSDFPDFASKAAAIKKHGLSWWESLPQRPTAPAGHPLTMNASQYSRMSLSDKAKFVSTYGSDAVAEILKRRR